MLEKHPVGYTKMTFSTILHRPLIKYALAAASVIVIIAAAVLLYSNRPINVQVSGISALETN
jgi:hypothetical protein